MEKMEGRVGSLMIPFVLLNQMQGLMGSLGIENDINIAVPVVI